MSPDLSAAYGEKPIRRTLAERQELRERDIRTGLEREPGVELRASERIKFAYRSRANTPTPRENKR